MAAATRRTLAHPVRVYLGTMTFGWDAQTSSAVGLPEARTFLERFDACGGETIDSARIYAAGRTETILGDAMISASEAPRSPKRVTTKVHPSEPGGLSGVGIRSQLAASFDAMQVTHVDELYLHQPDTAFGLEESLEACHTLVQEGMSDELLLGGAASFEGGGGSGGGGLHRQVSWRSSSDSVRSGGVMAAGTPNYADEELLRIDTRRGRTSTDTNFVSHTRR